MKNTDFGSAVDSMKSFLSKGISGVPHFAGLMADAHISGFTQIDRLFAKSIRPVASEPSSATCCIGFPSGTEIASGIARTLSTGILRKARAAGTPHRIPLLVFRIWKVRDVWAVVS